MLHKDETFSALNLIRQERVNQDWKWGEQNHDPLYWMSILMEEVGEAAKALIEGKMGDYFDEIIQVGAVAAAMLEAYARKAEETEAPDARS